MKYLKYFSLFIFIIVLIFSLLLNIYIVKAKNIPEEGIFALDGVYFDLSLIENKNIADEINKFIESNNSRTYVSLIKQKNNPIAQFYSFAALMRTNQKRASKHLGNLLLSEKKVNIFFSENDFSENNDLGYAILSLLNRAPENITAVPVDDFYDNMGRVLTKAYESNLINENPEYKEELLSVITKNVPELSKKIFGELVEIESLNNMTEQDKLELSFVLNSIAPGVRKKAIEMFLIEDNEQILLNALKAINSEDPRVYSSQILKIFYKRKSTEITKVAVEKYALLLEENSIQQIQNFMRVIQNREIITTGLDQIKTYGNIESYEFLKMYLGNVYSADVNLSALKAIIKISYESNPEDVLNTMAFILRNGKLKVAEYAIRFHIDNNIKANYGIVFYRLRKKENNAMKRLAIEYIDIYNLKAGYNLLKELSKDPNYEIRSKANKILPKFTDPSSDMNT